MAIIGTYGSAKIIAVPNSPGFKQIELVMNDTVSMSTSPWTGQTQSQWFPNDSWSGQITLPLMSLLVIGVWESWLAELRGMQNVFFLGHPLRSMAQGDAQGAPVLLGAHLAMAQVIHTTGWFPDYDRLLLPGDFLQIGNRLHRLLNVVSSDDNGLADIDIWPILREDVADGVVLILTNAQGLFRLAENKRSVTHTETRLGSITVKIMEAK